MSNKPMYYEVETVQELIDTLMRIDDKTKAIVYRDFFGNICFSKQTPLSIEENKSSVTLE